MIFEKIGRSIIAVLKSKYDVLNFISLYVPLGRIPSIIKVKKKTIFKIEIIASDQAFAFGVFQQSLLFPNERFTSTHGKFDIFMGISKERFAYLSPQLRNSEQFILSSINT